MFKGIISIENNEISLVDIAIASDELQLFEVYQQVEERLLENKLAWKPGEIITVFQFFQHTNLYNAAIGLDILPDGLNEEIIQYFSDPNFKPSFKILPLRGYPFESKIINIKDAGLIASWIDKRRKPYHFTNLPFTFMLIYRASRDGFGIENFHENCDNKGPTVVVIKVRNSGEIIGGYNPLKWCRIKTKHDERSRLLTYNNDFDHQCRTSNSFIFSLTNQAFPILSQVSSKEEAIIWCRNKGPCFCLQDLHVTSLRPNNIICKSKKHSYEKKVISRESFEIEEYEVFQIIDERFSQYIN
ncbi:31858_t:CDS:2, partial [Gigaspora margarita]